MQQGLFLVSGVDVKLVLPGDFLVCEEEFEAGKDAFQDNGNVYAAVCGVPRYDAKQHTVNVSKHREFEPLTPGSIVIGRVVLIKPAVVGLEVLSAERAGKEQILRDYFVQLPVRNMDREYVESPRDLYRIGDLVRAKVSKVTPYSVDVRTDELDLGVILAYSAENRQPLRLMDGKLKVSEAGDAEQRKISSHYRLH